MALQGMEGALQAFVALAVDHLKRDVCPLQELAQQGIDGRADVFSIALDAVGLPRHVEAGEQGEVECALVGSCGLNQALVLEDEFAVHGGHEGRGVGNHPIVCGSGSFDARLLLLRDVGLLVQLGCALMCFTPLAQVFVDGDGSLSCCAQVGGQRVGELGFAGAFCTEQSDFYCR